MHHQDWRALLGGLSLPFAPFLSPPWDALKCENKAFFGGH